MNRFILVCAGLQLLACGEETGAGDVAFTVWGEEYIEQEIPAEEFEDGFSVS
jgi:hypothetical protein